MKIPFLLLFLVISNFVQAQRYSEMKGKVFGNKDEFPQLKNCIKVNHERVDEDFICTAYLDTITRKHIVFVRNDYGNKILDIIVWGGYKEDEHLFIGSIESKKLKTDNCFVIAVDCCYSIQKPEDWPMAEKKISKAFIFNKSKKRFKKLKPNKVHRIHDGFYYY